MSDDSIKKKLTEIVARCAAVIAGEIECLIICTRAAGMEWHSRCAKALQKIDTDDGSARLQMNKVKDCLKNQIQAEDINTPPTPRHNRKVTEIEGFMKDHCAFNFNSSEIDSEDVEKHLFLVKSNAIDAVRIAKSIIKDCTGKKINSREGQDCIEAENSN